MKPSLNILHLEDNPLDADLIHATLMSADIHCKTRRVESRGEFIAEVERGGFDLILADYNLPSFDGVSALAIAKEKCPGVPFIFVTGSLGEERAIETLKNGATDYVLKDSCARIVPAVRRALDELAAQTQRKRLEDQLRHAQKMESIGTLAGGVAHDFNNLLTAIIGNAQLALNRINPEDPIHARLVEIENSGRRAAELTRQLLIFSRRERLEPRSINVNDTISQFIKMLRRIIGEDIDLKFEPSAEFATVFADPGQIEQVLMNLVVNARDAMPNGGQLVIETKNTDTANNRAGFPLETRPPRSVVISVSDTGEGMDAETQQHIFEPFFTTKEVGKGTGLGLALVYGIVKQHDGVIDVCSELGRGTTFRIYLPAQEQSAEAQFEENEPALRGGAETILVAEDEESLQRLLKSMLTSLGYNVILASDGEMAVETYSRCRDQIDLVMLDMVMPRMGGREAYDSIRKIRSDVPVLFMTGYSAEVAQTRFEVDLAGGFIQKPYGVQTLGQRVRETLDARTIASTV